MKLSTITKRLDKIAPLKFAEEWDNVGLLIEPIEANDINRIMLTIDLTESVVDEAIAENIDLIISYHPPIFNSIKRLGPKKPGDRVLLKLIQHNIAVYSPHTALDSAPGGTNDWLAGVVGAGEVNIIEQNPVDPNYGQGRVLTLQNELGVSEIISAIKTKLNLETVRFAGDQNAKIKTVAICAGAGSSVISNVNADLYLTGEMGHHYTLAATQNGRCVILCEHTNTERGFLPELRSRLMTSLSNEADHENLSIIISQKDRDPISFK